MRRLKKAALGSLLLLMVLGSALAELGRGNPTITPTEVQVTPSELPFTGGQVTITAEIVPATSSSGGCMCTSSETVALAQARVTVSPGAVPAAAMTAGTGNSWQAQINLPGNATAADIEYTLTVTATDANGESATPVSATVTVRSATPPPGEPAGLPLPEAR